MIKIALGFTVGLLVGAIVAAGVAPSLGVGGFSGPLSTVLFGYVCTMGVGGMMGLGASKQSGFRNRWASISTGAMIAFVAAYVLRSVGLPWLNLVWLDGTAGPAGELPFVVLPVVGMLVGGTWGGAKPLVIMPK